MNVARVAGPLLDAKRPLLALAGTLLALTACEPPSPQVENHPQWVIHSKVAFVEEDLATLRQPLRLSTFRLTFPYISGDLYGSPTIGDFIHPTINGDYTFVLDLNRTQPDLMRSLQPTEFSEDYLRIDPAEARIARLTPQALEADGIEQMAVTDWVDTRTHQRVMLLYVDRPARITGQVTRNGRTTHYNIRISKAGYVWIGSVQTDDDERMFREIEPPPEQVVLALAPKVDDSIHLPPPELPPVDNVTAHETTTAPTSASQSASSASPESSSAAALDLRGADSPRRAASRARGVPER